MGPGFPGNQGRISKLLRYKRERAKKMHRNTFEIAAGRNLLWRSVVRASIEYENSPPVHTTQKKKDFFLQCAAVPVKKRISFLSHSRAPPA